MKFILFMAFFLSSLVRAQGPVIVAAIDSNFDLSHTAVEYRIFKNVNEIPGDGIDNDGNGFVDDSIGWDIAGDDPNITLPTPIDLCPEDCRKFGEIYFKRRSGQASEQELLWLNEHSGLGELFFNYLTRIHGLAIIERMIRGTSHTYWVGLKMYEDSMLDPTINRPRGPVTNDLEKIYHNALELMTRPFERTGALSGSIQGSYREQFILLF